MRSHVRPTGASVRSKSLPSASLNFSGGSERLSEGPVSIAERAHGINDEAGNNDYCRITNFSERIVPLHHNVGKTGKGKNCGQRIEPHAEGPRHSRPTDAQHDDSNRLKNELQKNANHH